MPVKKLRLNDLKVNSFVTVAKEEIETVKGGRTDMADCTPCCETVELSCDVTNVTCFTICGGCSYPCTDTCVNCTIVSTDAFCTNNPDIGCI